MKSRLRTLNLSFTGIILSIYTIKSILSVVGHEFRLKYGRYQMKEGIL